MAGSIYFPIGCLYCCTQPYILRQSCRRPTARSISTSQTPILACSLPDGIKGHPDVTTSSYSACDAVIHSIKSVIRMDSSFKPTIRDDCTTGILDQPADLEQQAKPCLHILSFWQSFRWDTPGLRATGNDCRACMPCKGTGIWVDSILHIQFYRTPPSVPVII